MAYAPCRCYQPHVLLRSCLRLQQLPKVYRPQDDLPERMSIKKEEYTSVSALSSSFTTPSRPSTTSSPKTPHGNLPEHHLHCLLPLELRGRWRYPLLKPKRGAESRAESINPLSHRPEEFSRSSAMWSCALKLGVGSAFSVHADCNHLTGKQHRAYTGPRTSS